MSTDDPKVTKAKLENETLVRKRIIETNRLQTQHWEYATESLLLRDECNAITEYERDKEAIRRLQPENDLDDDHIIKYLDLAMKRIKSTFDKKMELIEKYRES